MNGDDQQRILTESNDYCRRLSCAAAKNFYYGMKLVPEPKRSAMFALYAWMRKADDLADEAGDAESKIAALEKFRSDTLTAIKPDEDLSPQDMPTGELWPAVRQMVLQYNMPVQYLHEMIDGQLLDQSQIRCKTFDQLYDYCYKVASVVGLCCIEIWGYEGGEQTRKLAEHRGVAFQLTNILRDVLEDADRDRVYLPAEDFDVFEINPSMFTLGRADNVLPGIAKTIDRAVEYYDRSASLDKFVHGDGRPCLCAMTMIYRGLLEKIRRNPSVVLSGQRVRLSRWRKTWIALRATMKRGVGL